MILLRTKGSMRVSSMWVGNHNAIFIWKSSFWLHMGDRREGRRRWETKVQVGTRGIPDCGGCRGWEKWPN